MSESEKFAKKKEQELFRHSRLGEHLLQRNKITLSQLNDAMEQQQNTGKLIGEIFVDNGYITRQELEEGLNLQHSLINMIEEIKKEIKDKITFKKVEE